MKYYLGLDIGTTNAKAVIFDEKFTNIYSSEKPILTVYPQKGYAEQDPDMIFEKVTDLIDEALQYSKKGFTSIEAIGLSSAMHSFLPVDNDFKPLSNAIIWSDLRSIQQANGLKENQISKGRNVPIHPMLPLAKWQWWHHHHDIQNVHKILSIKDYLVYKWTGQCVTEVSMASATGFFDIETFDWDDNLLSAINMSRELLPEIKPVTYGVDSWKKEVRERLGNELPTLVLGATDGCLANLAAGIKNHKQASLTIGTSAALRTTTTSQDDGEKGLFSYPVTKEFIVKGGALNNGGNVVEWLHRTFFEGTDFWASLNAALVEVNPGSDGLLFLPFLHGERAPFWNPEMKGAYMGLTHVHKKEHFIKSTLEGLTFALKHVMALLDKGNEIEVIIADGGFVKSGSWVQLVSDVLGKKLLLSSHSYGAALGAAMLARISVSSESIGQIIEKTDIAFSVVYPDKMKTKEYDRLFKSYLKALV